MSKSITDLQNKLNMLKSTTNASTNNETKPVTKVISPYFIDKKFQHAKHAEDMIQRFSFVYDSQILWRYHHDGYYKNDGEPYYRAIGQELIGESSRRTHISESLYYAQNERQLLEGQSMNPPSNLLNVKNGMLDPFTGQLLPHSPQYLCTYQLPVKFDSNANDPVIHNFVSSVLPEDSHEAFYELVGYILTNNLHMEKACLFTGVGSNGKSVAIDMITALLGKENVSNISLQDLDHRFRVAGLEGKLLNAFSDLPQKPIEDTGNFKAIVSNEAITIERKNKDPKSFQPSTKLLFSANHMVVTPDMSDGYFRRWLIFEFKNKFTNANRDVNLIHKLTTDSALSTLLNYAIQGIHRLHKNKQFTMGESLTNAIEQYRKHCDTLLQFVDEQCELAEDYYISTSSLYQHYRNFCDEWGIRNALGKKNFNQRLTDRFNLECKDKLINKRGIRCWMGIKVKEDFTDPFQ